jgi:hypothetical protein
VPEPPAEVLQPLALLKVARDLRTHLSAASASSLNYLRLREGHSPSMSW